MGVSRLQAPKETAKPLGIDMSSKMLDSKNRD